MSIAAVQLASDQRMLLVSFEQPQSMLSWAIVRGGVAVTQQVAWVFVRNEELTIGVDPRALLADRLAEAGLDQAVGLMTHSTRLKR